MSVGVGDTYACAVATSGVPTCWGDLTAPGATPTPKVLLSQVAVGGDHACGIASNGILVCWGADDVGQSDPPVPGAPVLTTPIPDQTATEDTEFTFEVPATTFTDTDPLTWCRDPGRRQGPADMAALRPRQLTFTGTPPDADVGALTVAGRRHRHHGADRPHHVHAHRPEHQ